jgi:hypothetical protein
MEQVQNHTIKNYNDMHTPHNPEAEKATIGALLLEKTAIYEVMDFLKPDMFYDEQLDEIYSVILEVESQSDAECHSRFASGFYRSNICLNVVSRCYSTSTRYPHRFAIPRPFCKFSSGMQSHKTLPALFGENVHRYRLFVDSWPWSSCDRYPQ